MVGYFTFYSCAVVSELEEEYRTCRSEGPAIFLNYLSDILGFLLQLALVWIAFLLLPVSKAKGKVAFKHYKKEPTKENQECCCCLINPERGGRLKCFMIYDIATFLGCIALFLALSLSDG